jgi:hypothetical protein
MAEAEVGVVGLRALARDFARAGDDRSGPLLKYLKDAGRAAATPVADAARSAYPHDTGTLAGDVRISSTRTGATVRAGRASVRYAGPVDFGGYPGERPMIPNGRYLFPAAHSLAETSARTYAEALQRGLDNFPWSNTTDQAASLHD